jgi:hypothetical protein
LQVRDLLACMQGTPPQGRTDGYRVRKAATTDADACNTVCRRVHGHDRAGEVRDAITQGTALVVEHDDRVTGYATDLGFFGHAVGGSNEDLKALIMAAPEFGGSGILVPTTNAALFQWCLERGLRVMQLMTLMSTGLYNRPEGATCPASSTERTPGNSSNSRAQEAHHHHHHGRHPQRSSPGSRLGCGRPPSTSG